MLIGIVYGAAALSVGCLLGYWAGSESRPSSRKVGEMIQEAKRVEREHWGGFFRGAIRKQSCGHPFEHGKTELSQMYAEIANGKVVSVSFVNDWGNEWLRYVREDWPWEKIINSAKSN